MLDTFCQLAQNSVARQIVAEQSREVLTIIMQTGGYPYGIIQGHERIRFLHAADAAKQNIDVDRIAGR